ncbi:MAG: methyltransferase domain-containing protein, partial [Burkholderiaceae bacterium]|nr:methyltransferase domain-containing protein [Burkholderiaceae bacterium]
RLLNLPALLRHLRTHRADRSLHDPADDLELALYGAIFGNNFLHYGYFPQPPADAESISLADLKRAMDDYATLLVERVRPGERVLDVGCGMGGLLARLDAAGARPVGVTPNTAHAGHIRARWPHIPLVESVFERIDATAIAPKFDAIVNAESFQYIDLDAGMRKVRALLAPGGRWIVIDYFRLQADAKNKSGHLLADFEAALARHGLAVAERVDVTENVLPTLAYGRLLATRFALPLARFASEKFFLRRPLAAYLFQPTVRAKLDAVKLDTLDPDVFRREKRYLLFTLRPD